MKNIYLLLIGAATAPSAYGVEKTITITGPHGEKEYAEAKCTIAFDDGMNRVSNITCDEITISDANTIQVMTGSPTGTPPHLEYDNLIGTAIIKQGDKPGAGVRAIFTFGEPRKRSEPIEPSHHYAPLPEPEREPIHVRYTPTDKPIHTHFAPDNDDMPGHDGH